MNEIKLKLVLKKQEQKPDIITVDHFPFKIGRAKDNDLIIDEPHISRYHAKLEIHEKNLVLIKVTKIGKLLVEGEGIEKQEISLPGTFEIPPFSFTAQKIQEGESKLESPPIETHILPEELKEEPQEMFPLTLEEEGLEETKVSTRRPKAKIVILKGVSPHESYDLVGDEIILGRDSSCDIVLEDEKVSREHARILLKDNHYHVKDSGSSNGTFLNHQEIKEEHPLSSGDQLQMGDCILQFALMDENIFALSPSETTERPSPDATQAGILAPAQGSGRIPHWEPEISDTYYPKKSLPEFLKRHQKLLFASAGLCLLGLAYILIPPSPPPQRETAQEKAGLRTRGPKEGPDELSELVKADREYVIVKMQEAKDFIKNRNYQQANIALQEIYAIIPNYKKAKALEQTIQYTLAEQAEEERKRKALLEEKKLEEEIKYHLSVALDYFNRQQWQKAVEEYDKILELHPEHEEAQHRKSLAQSKLFKEPKPKSLATLRQERNRKAERLLAKGSELSQKGDTRQALKIWREVLKLEEISPEYYTKAEKFIAFTNAKLSEKYLPLITQANVLIESGEYVQAQKILESILQEHPTHSEAQEALEKATNALHQRARREYTEAIIEENVGRIDAAIKKFKWITDRIPASDEYHRKARQKLKKYE